MTQTPSILVVGDIHKEWRTADSEYLEQGTQDLTLFVGDLGDEDVDMVRMVANIDVRKDSVVRIQKQARRNEPFEWSAESDSP